MDMPGNGLRTILLQALEIERPEEQAAGLSRVRGASDTLRQGLAWSISEPKFQAPTVK